MAEKREVQLEKDKGYESGDWRSVIDEARFDEAGDELISPYDIDQPIIDAVSIQMREFDRKCAQGVDAD